MSLNQLLTGTTTSKPWCDLIVNNITVNSIIDEKLEPNLTVYTDDDPELVSGPNLPNNLMYLSQTQTVTGEKTLNGSAEIRAIS